MIRFLASDLFHPPDHRPGLDLPAILAGKLGPALYHYFSETGGLSQLPPQDRTALQEAYDANARRNVILEHELHRIASALDRRQILHMPVKGAASLIDPLYPSPALRIMTDLDLLVPSDRRQAAVACLEALGYEARRERGAVLPEMEYPMIRNGTVVDLHWKLTRIKVSFHEEQVWQRARPAPGQPASLRLPANLDQFYIRFVHDTLQDHHLHACRLWQAYEAALLYRRIEETGEVDALCALAAEDGLNLVLGLYLAQVDRLFPCLTRRSATLQPLIDQGLAEIRICDSLGPWPRSLHFAVGRALLLRLRAPYLGGYRRAFMQIMWRECTLAEPLDVVRRNPAARAWHFIRLCLLHLIQTLWRQSRHLRRRLPRKDSTTSPLTWLHMHRSR